MGIARVDLTGHTILIVEEQPLPALNLQIALEQWGAEAVIARGSREAHDRLRQCAFSAAIIDPKERALARALDQRGVLVVRKGATRGELLAELAGVGKTMAGKDRAEPLGDRWRDAVDGCPCGAQRKRANRP